jgi:DNA-binding NtrC family response regulator
MFGGTNLKPWALHALHIGADYVDLPPDWLVDRVATAADGIDRLGTVDYDVAIISASESGGEVEIDDLLEQVFSSSRSVPVVVCDGNARLADAVRYMQLGAYDVAGPDDDAVAKIQRAADACRSRPAEAQSEPWREMLVGTSPAIRRTAEVIRLVARRRSTILITGETGSGKEVVARALHLASPRAQFPMIAVNVAALPEALLEAELFGHVRGALPARRSSASAAASRPTGLLSSWTRSAICLWTSKPSSCAFCRNGNSSAWAARKPFAWTCG